MNKPLKNLVLFYFYLKSLKVVRTSIMIATSDSSQPSHTPLFKDLSIHAASKIHSLTSSLHRQFVSLLLFLVIGLYFQLDFVENRTIHIPLYQYKCCFWNQVPLSNAINHIHLWPKWNSPCITSKLGVTTRPIFCQDNYFELSEQLPDSFHCHLYLAVIHCLIVIFI